MNPSQFVLNNTACGIVFWQGDESQIVIIYWFIFFFSVFLWFAYIEP